MLGPGEAYLKATTEIGDSPKSCDALKREHDDFELSARVRMCFRPRLRIALGNRLVICKQ